MSDTNNISAANGHSGKGKLPDEQLLAYLEGRLSVEEQHKVEQWLAEEGMESDAMEGLAHLPTQDITHTVSRINYKLQKDLRAKKRGRRYLSDNKWTFLAIAVILLLTVLGYLVIRVAVKQ